MNISDHTDVKTNSDKRCRIRQKLQEMDVSLHAPSQLNKNHENSMQKSHGSNTIRNKSIAIGAKIDKPAWYPQSRTQQTNKQTNKQTSHNEHNTQQISYLGCGIWSG